MAKKIIKCPICKSDINKHVPTKALDCVNDLKLQEEAIALDDAWVAGRKYGNLKGWGQKHGDKNIFTLNIKGKQVVSIEPELVILQDILKKNIVKEKKDERPKGSEEADSKSKEKPTVAEGSTS